MGGRGRGAEQRGHDQMCKVIHNQPQLSITSALNQVSHSINQHSMSVLGLPFAAAAERQVR